VKDATRRDGGGTAGTRTPYAVKRCRERRELLSKKEKRKAQTDGVRTQKSAARYVQRR